MERSIVHSKNEFVFARRVEIAEDFSMIAR